MAKKEDPDKSIKISAKAYRELKIRAATKGKKLKQLVDMWLKV